MCVTVTVIHYTPQWHPDMETLSASLALCDGNPPSTGGSPWQMASNVFFDEMPVIWNVMAHMQNHVLHYYPQDLHADSFWFVLLPL